MISHVDSPHSGRGEPIVNIFRIFSFATGAVVSHAVSFRVGSKSISLAKENAAHHLTMGEAISAVELAMAGRDGTFQIGAISIVVAEYGAAA